MLSGQNRALTKQIGQLFIIGFDGLAFNDKLARQLERLQPGGVILFSRNYRDRPQLERLCRDLQAWARLQKPPSLPLIISTDHEGGRVQRFKEGFTALPPARGIKTREAAHSTGNTMGKELRCVGVNMNMAPVLDVDSNPRNPIIGDRSFSAYPQRVAELAPALQKGMLEEGVVPVGKHFPGHGDTIRDSHLALPRVEAGKKLLEERELPPFAAAIREGIPAIMTAHVLYPALDQKNPATCSTAVLQGLLRESLGFSGVIMSDDMLMGALKSATIGEMTCRAWQAGVDMFIVGARADEQERARDALGEFIDKRPSGTARLEESLGRVLKLKEQYLEYQG